MTGGTTGQTDGDVAMGSLDADSVDRIDRYLRRAESATERAEKDFNVRHARQLLVACRE